MEPSGYQTQGLEEKVAQSAGSGGRDELKSSREQREPGFGRWAVVTPGAPAR